MSRYLIQRIDENPGIELHNRTEIVALEGDTHLERVTWRNNVTGATETHDIRHVFIMAGASPRTEWLRGCLALDEKGFIVTGRDLETLAAAALAALPPSPDARDQPARGLCRGRCPRRQRQTRSLRGRRRRHRRPHGPPRPGRPRMTPCYPQGK